MKKINYILVAITLILIFSFSLVGCNKCKHINIKLIEDTTTCESDGVLTYKCEYCGEIIKEIGKAKGHDYILVSDTSTCVNGGIKTSKCKHCNKVIAESVEAKGHIFSNMGFCTRSECLAFKYDIELSVELPVELKRVNEKYNRIYSKFKLTSLSFYISNYFSESYLYMKFDGQKTYDEDGEFGSEWASFTVVLKDINSGDIVGSSDINVTGLVVGQLVVGEKEHIVKTSLLDVNKKYFLQIVDKKI